MDTKSLIDRIENRDAVIGVVGLGYVGLPLALEFNRAKFRVLGIDVDEGKVAALNSGESYIQHIASEKLKDLVEGGLFSATSDFARVADVDAVVICVPTPLTDHREPDLSYIEQTARAIEPHIKPGCLVVLESTTYPGTTDEVVLGILEAGGKKLGADYLLAYSPEREDPGNPKFTTGGIPKVVGGVDEASCDVACALYDKVVVKTIRVSSSRTAEAVKLTENIFRSVNIALVNELKVIYSRMGIDVWEVIKAAESKPFGYMAFYPGPGLGGHCIPIDPFYLTWKAREYGTPTKFIELAGEINTSMPTYVIEVLAAALNDRERSVKGSRVLILGAAYKKDVGDMRESPSFPLMRMLLERGAQADYYDPFGPELPRLRDYPELAGRRSIEWSESAIAEYDAVLIATDHTKVDYAGLVRAARLIVDTRNATAGIPDPEGKVVKA